MDNRFEVVYNADYGGFDLSDEAIKLYNQKRIDAGLDPCEECEEYAIKRSDPHLIEVVKELGDRVNSSCSRLTIAQIPNAYKNCYTISEYDGFETVKCEPAKLIKYKLSNLDIDILTDAECRKVLQELKSLTSK